MKETEKNINPISIESNKYTLELVNGWINNADTKISIACGISSVVLAVIAFGAENILGDLAKNNGLNGYVMPLFVLAFAVACITFLVSLWYYFLALNPSLISSKSEIEKPKYSIFYKDISKFANVDAYMECMKDVTEEEFNQELMREIYINSDICTKKMQRFKTGMWCSVISIFAAVLACALFYLAIIL